MILQTTLQCQKPCRPEKGFGHYISNKEAEAKDTASDGSFEGGIHIGALQLDILDANEARVGKSNSLRLKQQVRK
jgi:hypothetical protein